MEETPSKKKSNAVLYFSMIVLLIAAAFVVYMVFKPAPEVDIAAQKGDEVTEQQGEVGETEETVVVVEQRNTEPGAGQDSVETTNDYKTEIDKDLQTLDSFDLSKAEDDFSEDKLDDL